MEFLLNGVRHSLEPEQVRSALRGGAPDDVREHWVEVDGLRWPPKQALALATGLERTQFTSHTALRQLRRLGFSTSDWGSSPRGAARRRSASAAGERPVAAPTQAVRPAGDIVLIGCSSSKAAGPCRAAELFTGPAFRKGRAYAEQAGVPWYVLSAKFGVLPPDEVAAPYDVYLGRESPAYRTAWGERVVAQLAERHDLPGAVVEVHAGRIYTEPLAAPLAAAGASLTEPLAGLRQGERLAWYGRGTGDAAHASVEIPDLAPLLDERTARTPAEFLAAGRAAFDGPGLYIWWADGAGAHALSAGLGHRVAPGLVYAGRAGGQRASGGHSTNTLWGRIATMHLGGKRNFSTFRLTLTAALSGQRVTDEAALTRWMHQHLRVAVLAMPSEVVFAAEEQLLELTDPPLNLSGVPRTPLRQTLSRLRSGVAAQK